MAKKRLLISTLVLASVLLSFNLLIGRTARTVPRLLLSKIQNADSIGILVIGNSLLASGFDEVAFRRTSPESNPPGPILNVACGATLPAEHLQFYNVAASKQPRIPCLIYGFYRDQMTASTEASWQDLSANRGVFFYSDFELGLSLYCPNDRLEATQLRLTRLLPAVYERSNIWRRVELLRRSIDRWGLPAAATMRFGRAADFASGIFLPKDNAAALEYFRRAAAEGAQLSRPVQTILRQAKAAGTKVIVIEMPLPLAHRQSLSAGDAWPKYRAHVRRLVEAEGADCVDALAWYSDDKRYFADDLHLNPFGAAEFSARLAESVEGTLAK
jgi:hypothetical protein